MKKLLIISTLFLAGCSTSSQSNYYVSPERYNNYSCSQLFKEMERISSKREQAVIQDNNGQIFDFALKAYTISQGGYYSESENKELQALNNTYEALEVKLIEKDC